MKHDPQGLKSVRENFRRPYGARDDLTLIPALNAPGYDQTPLRGANAASSFHRSARLKPLLVKTVYKKSPPRLAEGFCVPRSTS